MQWKWKWAKGNKIHYTAISTHIQNCKKMLQNYATEKKLVDDISLTNSTSKPHFCFSTYFAKNEQTGTELKSCNSCHWILSYIKQSNLRLLWLIPFLWMTSRWCWRKTMVLLKVFSLWHLGFWLFFKLFLQTRNYKCGDSMKQRLTVRPPKINTELNSIASRLNHQL